MTHTEIAKRLRGLVIRSRNEGKHQTADAIEDLADELDPPRPEPGTVVWVRWNKTGLQTALVDADGKGVVFNNNSYLLWEEVIECVKPRILAQDEVAVKVPRVSEWRDAAIEVWLEWRDEIGEVCQKTGISITRAEAERLLQEAER